MARKKTQTARLANTFGIFGYLSLCFQWLWAGAVLVPSLLENESIRGFLLPEADQTSTVAQSVYPIFSPVLIVASVIITIVVVIVSVIILIRLPMAIAKTGKKTMQTTAKAIIPIIAHHQKIPERKRKILTGTIVKYLKFTLTIVPILVLLITTSFIRSQISNELLIFIEATLTIGSLLWFSLQYLVARWKQAPIENLV